MEIYMMNLEKCSSAWNFWKIVVEILGTVAKIWMHLEKNVGKITATFKTLEKLLGKCTNS